MPMHLVKQEWRMGRLHRWWFDPWHGKAVHEMHEPPEPVRRHFRALKDLRDNRKERARKADGVMKVASFTMNERDRLHRDYNIRLGDTEGLKWALKRLDEYSHCKVADT